MSDEHGKILETVMGMIMHGGDEKSSSLEAIQAAKSGDFEGAIDLIESAEEALIKAQKSHSKLLTKEASEDDVELSLLMIHGQDHLMNAITTKDLAIEFIDVYRKFDGQDVSGED